MSDTLKQKLEDFLAMVLSRRTLMMVGAVSLIIWHDRLGLDDTTVQQIQQVLIAWILGQSLLASKLPGKDNPPSDNNLPYPGSRR